MAMTLDEAVGLADAARGLQLTDVAEGAAVEVRTHNHTYRIMKCTGGKALISGHPEFCPEPVAVSIHGSTWGGSMLKTGFIGLGMRLEYSDSIHASITTSPIVAISHPVDYGHA